MHSDESRRWRFVSPARPRARDPLLLSSFFVALETSRRIEDRFARFAFFARVLPKDRTRLKRLRYLTTTGTGPNQSLRSVASDVAARIHHVPSA